VLVKVADPAVLTVAVPRTVLLVEKVTVPDGVAVAKEPLTSAVKVILVPGATGVLLDAVEVRVVVVAAKATLAVSDVAVLPAKLESPL